MKNTIFVNLYAGPGTGKTTVMAETFSELKWDGVDCEMVPEYAKEIVWEESFKKFDSQIYIFGKQFHRLKRLKGKVDVVITDAPLLNFHLFTETLPEEERYAMETLINSTYLQFNNLDFLLKRTKPYNPNGRTQNEEEAKMMDKRLYDMLAGKGLNFTWIDAIKKETVRGILAEMQMRQEGRI